MSEEKKVPKKSRVQQQAPVLIEEAAVEESELQPECSPWAMRVAGLKFEIPVSAMKLPTFTTGMINRGEATIEVINSPELSLNAYFRAWMAAPSPRTVELDVFDAAGEKIELWKMSAVPAAMGFSEFSTMAEDPWSTQVMFSVSDIKIESKMKY